VIRVLFVDDEPDLLDGLKDALRRYRTSWDMRFAVGAARALEELWTVPCDAIVSDLRMPGMPGDVLLGIVAEHHPHVARLILSGNVEHERTPALARSAHQFLAKPCDPELLHDAVARAVTIRERIDDPGLRRLVAGLGDLPVSPSVHDRILASLDAPLSSLADTAPLVAQDPALAAKVMQVARSAFTGARSDTTDLKQAVVHIGSLVLRGLVIAAEMEAAFASPRAAQALGVADLAIASMATAGVARAAARRWRLPAADEAFLAGLLHELGALVLAARDPGRRRATVAEARQARRRIDDVETEMLGTTHADLGAYLLSLWGLPQTVVDAVLRHHEAEVADRPSIALAVHVASALVAEALQWPAGPGGHLAPDVLGALSPVETATSLDELRAIASAHIDNAKEILR